MNLGIDIGRCIKGPSKEQYSEPMPGAFETISKLTKKFNNTYIVSRVNSEQRERAIKWLEEKDFYNLTGIPKENVYYCFDRRDKAIYQRGLKINVFIDDRPNCLIPMENHVKKILFNPWEGDLKKYKDELNQLENLIIIKNWKEIGEYFKV